MGEETKEAISKCETCGNEITVKFPANVEYIKYLTLKHIDCKNGKRCEENDFDRYVASVQNTSVCGTDISTGERQ